MKEPWFFSKLCLGLQWYFRPIYKIKLNGGGWGGDPEPLKKCLANSFTVRKDSKRPWGVLSLIYSLHWKSVDHAVCKLYANVLSINGNIQTSTQQTLWTACLSPESVPLFSCKFSRSCTVPGDLVTQFGGLGRKILTPYPTTARGLRCCSQTPCSISAADHSVSTTFPVTE